MRIAERLQVVGLAAGENDERLAEQVERYRPRRRGHGVRSSGGTAARRSGRFRRRPSPTRGRDGLVAVASHPDADIVLCASSGTDALEAVLAAIDCGKTIALANKEILVMAGAIVMEAARRHRYPFCQWTASTTPFISACTAATATELKRLVLTASGGPFRGRPASELAACLGR